MLYLFVVLWVHRWDMAPASLFGFTSDDGMKAGLTLPTQSEVRNTAHVFSEPSFLHFWLGGNNHPPILCVLVFGWGESTRHKFMLYICIFVQICVDVQRLDPCRTDDKTSASVRFHVCRLVAPMFCTTVCCRSDVRCLKFKRVHLPSVTLMQRALWLCEKPRAWNLITPQTTANLSESKRMQGLFQPAVLGTTVTNKSARQRSSQQKCECACLLLLLLLFLFSLTFSQDDSQSWWTNWSLLDTTSVICKYWT